MARSTIDEATETEFAVWPPPVRETVAAEPRPALEPLQLAALERDWLDCPEQRVFFPVLSETGEQRAERIAERAQRDVPLLLREIRRLRDTLEQIRYAASL